MIKRKSVNFIVNNQSQSFSVPSSFNGKEIVIWLADNPEINIRKVKISNFSSTLSLLTPPLVAFSRTFMFTTESGILSKLMFSPNFYDFDSEQFHKVMIQEKINGSYIQGVPKVRSSPLEVCN